VAHGASLVLEGIDILQSDINAFCAALDAPHECVVSNAVAFFSQRGNEAYRGHLDLDDVLVVHLGGRKHWRIYERQAPRRTDMFDLPPEKMGRLVAEFDMQPGDALYMRSKTPHLVETADEYSLHMSFDLCDRNLSPETALHLLMAQYDRDSAPSYAPVAQVMDKLIAHAGTPAYKASVADLQGKQKENYRRARAVMGANRVNALDRWIAQAARGKK
jgi:ribosomal protein L16 Arg81 hydroxylase